MTRNEAIEKMVAIKALVQMTRDTYMVNLEGCRMGILPSRIVIGCGGRVWVNIAYSDMSDIYSEGTDMVIEVVGEVTCVRLPIDCK